MGNAVSKAVDFGLKAACYATGGLFGKSSEGYHLGPLRIKKDSVGVRFNAFGVCRVGLNIGRNEFGKWGLDASASVGINGLANGTIRGGWDEDGFYVGVAGTLNAGTLKYNGSVVANRKGVRSMEGGVSGPLLTNINYSSYGGLSVGAFGVTVNTNLETDFSNLEDNLAKKAGEKAKEKYKQYHKTKKEKSEKKKESNDKTHETHTDKEKDTESETQKANDGIKNDQNDETEETNVETKAEGEIHVTIDKIIKEQNISSLEKNIDVNIDMSRYVRFDKYETENEEDMFETTTTTVNEILNKNNFEDVKDDAYELNANESFTIDSKTLDEIIEINEKKRNICWVCGQYH